MFFSRSFIISGHKWFTFVTHFELIFLCGKRGPVSFFFMCCVVFSAPFIKDTVLSLCLFMVTSSKIHYICIGSFLDSQFCFINLCAYFYVNTILFWLLQLCNVLYFEIRQYDASSFAFLFKHCFDYSGSFVVPYKFQDFVFNFC